MPNYIVYVHVQGEPHIDAIFRVDVESIADAHNAISNILLKGEPNFKIESITRDVSETTYTNDAAGLVLDAESIKGLAKALSPQGKAKLKKEILDKWPEKYAELIIKDLGFENV